MARLARYQPSNKGLYPPRYKSRSDVNFVTIVRTTSMAGANPAELTAVIYLEVTLFSALEIGISHLAFHRRACFSG